jgi:peroxiredoxin
VAQLCQYADDLERLDTRVLLVSFSSPGYARRWIEETCAPFHLLLDRDRAVYRAYGLGSSLTKSWSPKIVWSYVKLMRAGRRWRGIQGNSAQMGGDFVVDAEGIVRLAYRSEDPADRPPVERLMTILKQISERES